MVLTTQRPDPRRRFSLLAKPAMRPRMLLRALRPPMILGASLPGMIFPAQRPAEGSNSYHYGSHATRENRLMMFQNGRCFHTTMVLTQLPVGEYALSQARAFPYHYGSHATRRDWPRRSKRVQRFHTTMVLTQRLTSRLGTSSCSRFHTTMVLTQRKGNQRKGFPPEKFPYHYGSHATRCEQCWQPRRSRFHTTMVLTQHKYTE